MAPVNPEVTTPQAAPAAAKKRKFPFGWIIVGVVVVYLILSAISAYNRFVTLDKQVDERWAEIENALKRRSDLVPNLVATVKAYAAHEEEVFVEVTRARAKLDNAEGVEDVSAAAGGLSQALSRLMVVVEAYPEIKANENFLQLQAELEGTENRIYYARTKYNEKVREYNTAIKRFPAVLFAGLFGFSEREFFEATDAERQTPDVEQLFNG